MKRHGIFALASLASLALGGCVVVDADVHETGWDWGGDFGYVLGADVSARGPDVTITAHSNGCTNKDDFRPVVRDRGEGRFNVGFRRVREDTCKALAPDGRSMTWSFAELGLPPDARIMIMNPVGR